MKKPPNARKATDLMVVEECVKNLSFFQKIIKENKDTINKCCCVMTLEIFKQTEKVFAFGDKGDKFYIIMQARAR